MNVIPATKTRTASTGATLRRCESSRAGFTLVELMVATLIGIIVFTAWLTICNPKPVVKESYRREAVERAAGYMDKLLTETSSALGAYKVEETESTISIKTATKGVTQSMFTNAESVVGYTLSRESRVGGNWSGTWACIRLYDEAGIETNGVKPFFELSAFYK